jgi:cytidylate kinase
VDDVSSRVLFLTGPPGAGKTTVARLVAERFERAVHIESDLFFHFIASGFIEPWKSESHEQNEIVMGVVADAATSYAQASYPTVVEGILLPGWFYEPVRDHLQRAGLDVATAILRPSLTTCVRRARRRASDPLADPAVVEQLWRGFTGLGPLERFIVDNEGQEPDATAQAVFDLWAT